MFALMEATLVLATVAQRFRLRMIPGSVIDPPRRLVQTMTALWGDDVKAEGETRITWEIEPVATTPAA